MSADKEYLTIFCPVNEEGEDDKDGKFLRVFKRFVDGSCEIVEGIYKPLDKHEEREYHERADIDEYTFISVPGTAVRVK